MQKGSELCHHDGKSINYKVISNGRQHGTNNNTQFTVVDSRVGKEILNNFGKEL